MIARDKKPITMSKAAHALDELQSRLMTESDLKNGLKSADREKIEEAKVSDAEM